MQKGIDYIGICIGFNCHDGNGNFLMSKRSKNTRDEQGNWDFGGSGLELGEKVEDCLRRELREEYGVQNIKYDFLGYLDIFRKINNINTHWISLEFLVQVDPKEVINGEPHKFEEIGWFKLNDLPSPLHSSVPTILEKFKDKLK